jgi:hypothetical protein
MSKPSSRPSKIKVQSEPFNLDAIEKEAGDKVFRFTLGGRDWEMIPLGQIDRKQVKKIAKLTEGATEAESIEAMLTIGLGDEQWVEFEELPLSMEGLRALFEAWTDHSGIDVPESSASPGS